MARGQVTGLLCHRGVMDQVTGCAVGHQQVPLRRREPEIERQQHGADPCQRKQQHQLPRMVQPQPGHPVTGAHAPCVPQNGGCAVALGLERAVRNSLTAELHSWSVRLQRSMRLKHTGQRLSWAISVHLPNFTAGTSDPRTRGPIWPPWTPQLITIRPCNNC